MITPEFVYTNMQIVEYGYSRTSADGLQLLRVSIAFEESKTAQVSYETEEVKNVDDSKEVDSGKVQATENRSLIDKWAIGGVNLISTIFGN